MLNQILKQFTVMDIEATGLDLQKDEIVELASAFYKDDRWYAGGMLFNTVEPIPFATSAIHQISRNMVKDKPLFGESINKALEILRLEQTDYLVSHNVDYDMPMLVNNFKRANKENYLGKFLEKKYWVCTVRLAKHLMPEIPSAHEGSYKLNYLRYALDLYPEGDTEQAHRATTDTKICANLLSKLIERGLETGVVDPTKDIGEQLSSICWQTIKITKWPFGKYKGYALKDIPLDYYEWALDKLDSLNENHPKYDPDLAATVVEHLSERLK